MKNLIYILIIVVLHFGSFALMGNQEGSSFSTPSEEGGVIVNENKNDNLYKMLYIAAGLVAAVCFALGVNGIKYIVTELLALPKEILLKIKSLFSVTTMKLPSVKLPNVEFQDSGWILLYRIAGWLCVIVGSIVLIVILDSDAGSSTEEGFVFFCCALLAASANFFTAHILRLQEKTAAFSEVTAGIMEKHHELMVENVNLLRSIAQKTEDKG